MFLKFLYPLVSYFSAFNIFKYLTFRAAYAAITALVVTFFLAPKLINWLRVLKFGQSIRTDGPQSHQVKKGTPTMGGVIILFAVLIAVIFWTDLDSIYIWLCIGALIGFGALGFLDDWLKIKKRNSDGISARVKLIGQLIVSSTIVIILYSLQQPETTKLYLPFFKYAVIDLKFVWVPLAILYIISWSNAVNLTDGLDGLATGLLIITFITLALLTYITGRPDWAGYLGIPYIKGAGEITVFIFAITGACVGFLWYNAHPAAVFMGDVGSLSLGGITAIIGLLIKKEILLVIIGGVFILEILSVSIQVLYFKATKGKRIFKMSPLHHHFELSGWAETQVVTRFWILGGLFAIVALSTLKTQ